MGNVLENVSKDNTRFTIFENDQVLTAAQLNDLFNYLDVQTRLTRTKAIGVGIICGLEIGMLENKHIVVSKGTAVTTDGDLLHYETDQEFDLYEVFEDINAKYSYFRIDGQVITMYELRNSGTANVTGQSLSAFEETTNSVIKDYVGVLYLEDYKNDPDVCTGTNCDNKGAELIKELKILLIHKNNMQLLLESMPSINKNYFALDDIVVPRVSVQTSILTYQELNTAFSNSLTIKDEIKNKLINAYQVCKLMLDDEFDGGDPTPGWGSLLDQHFQLGTTIYAQYVYDFARDISYAYNEMRETLFSDDMLCCPDVQLFPKHVLTGLVKTASVTQPSVSSPLTAPVFSPVSITNRLRDGIPILSKIRFDIGLLIRRFHPVHIDLQYRHHFYESPALNNKNENSEQTKFCFMRINAMITNFKVPSAEELQNVNQSLKIIPSQFEDKPLGERSIPFYYRFNSNLPSNLYWNFNANTRKKEDRIYSYSANQYSTNPPALSPLNFNILQYDFFRVEGHIGFTRTDVEAALNNVILTNNLPINIITVQVESTIETIPDRPWFFPHLHMYEKAQQRTFLTRLDKTDTVNDELKAQDDTILNSEFKIAKQTVLDNNKDVSDKAYNFNQFSLAVSNVITAASNVKAQTKKYTFSNAAIPHDFVNNTDILQKTDVIFNIFQQHIIKKKQGLMLGNFMKQNPGLEHAGGVLRGGTFVLVYTAADQKVVADFMLPYASIDKDIVIDPPIYKPIPILEPPILHFPLDKLFEKTPFYQIDLNTRFNDLDNKVDTKIGFLSKASLNIVDNVVSKYSTNVGASPNTNGLMVAGKDFTEDVRKINQIQRDAEVLPPNSPEKLAKETELLAKTQALTQELSKPEITSDKSNAFAVNSILSTVHASADSVQSEALKPQALDVTKSASTLTRNFNQIQ